MAAENNFHTVKLFSVNIRLNCKIMWSKPVNIIEKINI